MKEIHKPIHRSYLRKVLGKEYFILKRRSNWWFSNTKWAKKRYSNQLRFEVFKHKSIIRRPLKDLEMHLQDNKRVNLEIAIKKLNSIEIQPGEVFSIWKNVGRPTKNKGYLDGLVLNQGKTERGIGGGLCQLGNLLFWIYAHSPLDIIERHRHGFDVFPDVNRKVPFGAGATLSYNHIDLQVKNNTSTSFQILLWLDDTHLHGKLMCSEILKSSFKVEERNHVMNRQYWGGYSRHNQIFKIEKNEHHNEIETLLVENHALMMYNPFLNE